MLVIIAGILIILTYLFFILGAVKDKNLYIWIAGLGLFILILIMPRISTIKRNSKHYTISTEIRQKIVNDSLIKSDTIYIIKYKVK